MWRRRVRFRPWRPPFVVGSHEPYGLEFTRAASVQQPIIVAPRHGADEALFMGRQRTRPTESQSSLCRSTAEPLLRYSEAKAILLPFAGFGSVKLAMSVATRASGRRMRCGILLS